MKRRSFLKALGIGAVGAALGTADYDALFAPPTTWGGEMALAKCHWRRPSEKRYAQMG